MRWEGSIHRQKGLKERQKAEENKARRWVVVSKMWRWGASGDPSQGGVVDVGAVGDGGGMCCGGRKIETGIERQWETGDEDGGGEKGGGQKMGIDVRAQEIDTEYRKVEMEVEGVESVAGDGRLTNGRRDMDGAVSHAGRGGRT